MVTTHTQHTTIWWITASINKEECRSLGIVSDTMMKSPTNLSCGSQRMDMQTGEGKQWLMLTTCCKIQDWETQVNCRQSWWTEGAGRAVCSTRDVLKDDQDEMRLIWLNVCLNACLNFGWTSVLTPAFIWLDVCLNACLNFGWTSVLTPAFHLAGRLS